MDLKSGYPFWIVRNGLPNAFPTLDRAHDCDVLVVGAGITGALIAAQLQADGLDVAVIDRREACWGSTSASTALLQYEIDTEMQELADRYGEADAVLAYRACAQAIPELARIARRFRGVDFQSMRSLYFASHWYHEKRLRREGALRQKHGFELDILEAPQIRKRYGFDAPVALDTRLAAEVDPYQLAQRLLANLVRRGGHVFDRTAMSEFKTGRGRVVVETEHGHAIRCRHLVLAAGYETQDLIDEKVAKNRSSYAYVTDPVADPGPLKHSLVWESARPYLYVRRTGDNRIIVGGEDDKIDIAARRDAKVGGKAAKLHKKISALFPELDLEPVFAWAGTFAETDDGLPFFGTHGQHGPRVHFAMAYGGNGITYSMIGAGMLSASLAGKSHPCADLFSFDRLKRT